MTTQEIYNLASEMTDQMVINVVSGWERYGETCCISKYKSLVNLGDSKQLACATVIAEKYNDKGISNIYKIAYES